MSTGTVGGGAIRDFDDVPRPGGLDVLVEQYRAMQPSEETYNPAVWVHALDGVLTEPFVRGALERPDVTARRGSDRRAVNRAGLVTAVSTANFDDDDSVLAAWLLVQAWGNGTRSRWGRQNTATALAHRDDLLTALRTTATILREARTPTSTEDAYRAWRRGIGINESFLTKWFAFAGLKPGRPWQPLILDQRVWRTMNKTLGLTLRGLAGTTRQWTLYRAYVEMLHAWGGSAEGAQRLEWVMFKHNGLTLTTDSEALGARP